MARTPMFSLIRRALGLAHSAERAGVETREHIERIEEAARLRRRDVLKAAAGGAALCATPIGALSCGGGGGSTARVAIVGAGLAGLQCASTLKKGGILATVYEAGERAGGRAFTSRGKFMNGQVAELGGEFIDSDHMSIRSLANQLGEPLDDLTAIPMGLKAQTYRFFDREVPLMEIAGDFRALAPMLAQIATRSEQDPTLRDQYDRMSLGEWLGSLPGTEFHRIRGILQAVYEAEFGLDSGDQSLFNLVDTIDYKQVDPFRILGDADRRYHLRNGSDALATKLAGQLTGQIETGARLMAVSKTAGGKYQLALARGSGMIQQEFEHVILTLPFTMLRAVDLKNAQISDEKRLIIDTLGYGTHTKLVGAFTSRFWRDRSASGSAFSDNGAQAIWDSSIGQPGSTGLLTNQVAGTAGLPASEGTPEQRYMIRLSLFEQIFPGAQAAYVGGSAIRTHWPSAPFHAGSTSCLKIRQYGFRGKIGKREGNLHFAGEHTAAKLAGTMEGACTSGTAAAMEVLGDLGLHARLLRARVYSRALV